MTRRERSRLFLRILAILSFLWAVPGFSRSVGGPVFHETGRSGNAVFYAAVMDGVSNSVLVVRPPSSVKAKKLVVIIPGYEPKGDPYEQSPRYFLERWDLSDRAGRTGCVFLVPGSGDSVHPLTGGPGGTGGSSVISSLSFMEAVIAAKTPAGLRPEEAVFIGVSTGVEGAVKYLSRRRGPRPVTLVALSGTWDYSLLAPADGEYLIHRKVFGSRPGVWERESPLAALAAAAAAGPVTVHAFSEELSIYRKQMLRLGGYSRPGLKIVLYPEFGKGLGHGWSFWSDRRLVDRIFSLVETAR